MGCVQVQSSPWSELGGIHVAYIGLLGYVLIFALAVGRSMSVDWWAKFRLFGFIASAIGLLYSIFLTFISISMIHATCIWCLSSFATLILLTIAHAALFQSDAPDVADRRMGLPITGASFLLALGIGAVVVHNRQKELDFGVLLVSAKSVQLEDALPQQAKVKGNADAKVTLIEFADMNCPSCRGMYATVESLYSDFGGRLRVAYRNFPLIGQPGHETSANAALIGQLAAEKGIFWKYLHTIMEKENTERIKTMEGLVATATDAGLSRKEIVSLFNPVNDEESTHAKNLLQKVADDIDAARNYRIASTPTFIVYAEGQEPKAVSMYRLDATLRNSPYIELLRK